MGSLADLKKVAEAVNIPIMRKDFIIDEYQIWQAKYYGASSFLLLAGTLIAPNFNILLRLAER